MSLILEGRCGHPQSHPATHYAREARGSYVRATAPPAPNPASLRCLRCGTRAVYLPSVLSPDNQYYASSSSITRLTALVGYFSILMENTDFETKAPYAPNRVVFK
jgi:hypothetical protein